jgi:cytochrome c-type biogenesis protein CcmH
MTLWLLLTILCSATAVVISIPLIRRYEDYGSANQDQAIYQDQLKELDRDQTAGSIDTTEAEAARGEIRRRLATAEAMSSTAKPISSGWKMLALASTAGLVILGGVNLYATLGSPELPSVVSAQPPAQQAAPQAAAEAPAAAAQTAPDAAAGAGQVESMITKLQARLQTNPKDAEGWRMLGWAQFNTQHFAASAEAYAKALEIDPANMDYKSAYAESLVQSAEGVVTPKAQTLIAEVLAKDPKEYRARFYDALAHEQAGDQNGALDRWMGLLADAPADANWRDDVKQRVVNLGKATGHDVAAATTLPKLDGAAPTKPLAADEKNAMVAGMIAKLATKLEANPKDRDGWAMMIRSLAVTGDKKGAEEALNKATEIFKGDQGTIDGLNSIAKAAGVASAAGPANDAAASAIPPAASAPQITDEQKAAVQALPADDQQAMIKGMVAKLADKLKVNPVDPDGWIRLIRSYQVLNDGLAAKDALSQALTAFANDPVNKSKVVAAADELGVK